MVNPTVKISDTARAMLTLAAARPDRLIRPPRLPAAAARQVVRSLLNKSFVEEVPASIEDVEYHWRTDADGVALMLRATDTGLAAIKEQAAAAADAANAGVLGADTADEEAVAREAAAVADARQAAPTVTARATLRRTAEAVLSAWADEANRATNIIGALEAPMAALRAAMGERGPRTTTVAPRKPREGTKQAQVLAMLRRPEGATVAQIAEAMTWAPHAVRGFFASLKKKGITVAVLERVRQIGKSEAKRS